MRSGCAATGLAGRWFVTQEVSPELTKAGVRRIFGSSYCRVNTRLFFARDRANKRSFAISKRRPDAKITAQMGRRCRHVQVFDEYLRPFFLDLDNATAVWQTGQLHL
jgi:hypothetical protein